MGGAIYFVMGDWNRNYTLFACDGISGKELWRYAFRGWPDPSNIGPWFVVQQGMCLAVEESAISRLDPQSGNLLWRFPTSASLLQTPAVSRDGVIYIGDADEMLAALRADDATVLWRILLNQPITAPPLINEDVVVVGMNEHVHAVSPSDGALIWRVRLTKDYSDVSLGMNPVAVLDSTLYVLAQYKYAEDNAGQAQAFDTRDGSLLWRSETPWVGYYAELLGIVDELLYIGGIDGGTCVALNRQDGREVWYTKGGEYLVTPKAVFQTVNSGVEALRLVDGTPLWSFHP
jgi:outer membrane protein assembly factor BamB